MDKITKVCTGCGLPKDRHKEFSWKSKEDNTRETQCRLCRNVKQTVRNAELRYDAGVRIYKYLLDHPCVDCGTIDPLVLEFDHIRGHKVANISKMASKGYTWETIEEEISKCDVRCANCHNIKTATKNRTYKFIINESME